MMGKKLLDYIKKCEIGLDEARFRSVYEYVKKAHKDQVRHTGDPYITHPVETVKILAKWGLPQVVLEAALLHEVIEEAGRTGEEIKKLFGGEVLKMLEGVSKVGQVKLRHSKDGVFVENLRKMFVAMARDVRVVLIRLADRLDNIRTLKAVPLSKQKRIALETLEVYAPLAERLCMGQLKGELENLSFPYVYPLEHKHITKLIKKHMPKMKLITLQMIGQIKSLLKKNGVAASVHGRPKNKYSVYKKYIRPGIDRDITRIHDFVALRIITQSKKDCYVALGLAHGIWKPVPYLNISDFIAQPKPNGYQSIHTKVFNQQGQIIELQIRTQEMHEQAEFGAAAHYAYSEAKASGVRDEYLEKGVAFKIDQKMAWISQLSKWKDKLSQDKAKQGDFELDALSHRIYVFSPKGDVYDLPVGATPVDFAFAVHSDLGFHLQSAKVNEKMSSIDKPLSSGDVVEIVKSKQRRFPSRDWLRFVKTARARQKIRQGLGL